MFIIGRDIEIYGFKDYAVIDIYYIIIEDN